MISFSQLVNINKLITKILNDYQQQIILSNRSYHRETWLNVWIYRRRSVRQMISCFNCLIRAWTKGWAAGMVYGIGIFLAIWVLISFFYGNYFVYVVFFTDLVIFGQILCDSVFENTPELVYGTGVNLRNIAKPPL